MRERLAEQLLAKVMGWTEVDIARERPDLQAMADYKYDDYEQFSPGMHFQESLASWLDQFDDQNERVVAYNFVKHRMLFVSAPEINHCISMVFPDFIRPYLSTRVAAEAGLDPRRVAAVAARPEYKVRQCRCLYLGLSDGARTDTFRRHNAGVKFITNENVRQTHELSDERAESLLGRLKSQLTALHSAEPNAGDCTFKTLILLDDFSASGLTYLRTTDNKVDGKVGKLLKDIGEGTGPLAALLDPVPEVVVVLFVATEQARDHLDGMAAPLCESIGASWRLMIVNLLPSHLRVRPGVGDDLEPLIEAHYDSAVETGHTWVGGTDLKYGFAACGLPLVLAHNTPNNSIALLWGHGPSIRALFPRVTRHTADL